MFLCKQYSSHCERREKKTGILIFCKVKAVCTLFKKIHARNAADHQISFKVVINAKQLFKVEGDQRCGRGPGLVYERAVVSCRASGSEGGIHFSISTHLCFGASE